jgi:uncharacterized protein YktB (UPF0637 family)
MNFQGFTQEVFDTFHIEGLEPRMVAIKSRIQPKFKELGNDLLSYISALSGDEMYLHIAQHARRKVNAPVDTWMAFSSSKRGYKQLPHFQIGLFDDRVFLWLAFIYELPNKKAVAENFLKNIDEVTMIIPKDFSVSFDHMKKDVQTVGDLSKDDLKKAIIRFRDVKSTEILIGRNIMSNDPILYDGKMFIDEVQSTFQPLSELLKFTRI